MCKEAEDSEPDVLLGEETRENTEKSIAIILREQYVEKGMESILGATEVHERECLLYAHTLMAGAMLEIMSTKEAELDSAGTAEEIRMVKRKLALRKLMLEDPCKMVNLIISTWNKNFGLLRISLERKSRGEAKEIACAGVTRSVQSSELGLRDKLLSRLGLGGYRRKTTYEPKEGE
jgi:hypothetical protein